MQLHELKRKTKHRRSRQIGRGGKRGTTSGRGTKGQKARAGHKIRPEIRDLIKKLPKLRGRGKNSNLSVQTPVITISLARLSKNYAAGDTVNLATLSKKGLINRAVKKVKIVGSGELKYALNIKGCEVSAGAREIILKAGGKIA